MVADKELGPFFIVFIVFHVIIPFSSVNTLDNGLALTPPMGWMAWERFRCNIDCKNDPENCVSEKLFIQMADRVAEDGYKEAGYQYVCIDDCWSSPNRTIVGDLQPDPERFPNGIKYLADYIHSKGLKFGLYADYGKFTCERYPGSIDYIQQDMELFADWGVDYLKMDGCFADPLTFDEGYPSVTKALNESGRHIVFSCSWPAYQVWGGMKPNYQLIAKNCNLWRNYNDIQDSWYSLLRIFDWFGDHQHEMRDAHGPGHWNDPDQLLIGDFSLSYEQSKAQFAIWAILAAPLMMSNDLRNIAPWARDILLNKEVIDVNQDVAGKMGYRVLQDFRQFTEVWARPLSDGAVAVVLFSRRTDQPFMIEAEFNEVGLATSLAKARDLFEQRNLGTFKNIFKAKVNPSGVVMVKLSPIQDEL